MRRRDSKNPEASNEVYWVWGRACHICFLQPIKPGHARPQGAAPAPATGTRDREKAAVLALLLHHFQLPWSRT